MAAKTTARPRRTRGGYEAGPKLVSELKPPPRTRGAGVKLREDSSKRP
jgi:hypothetical protein